MGLYFRIGDDGTIQKVYKVRAMRDTPRPVPLSPVKYATTTYAFYAPFKTLFVQGAEVKNLIVALQSKTGADLIEAIERFAVTTGLDLRVDVDPETRTRLFTLRDGTGDNATVLAQVVARYIDP